MQKECRPYERTALFLSCNPIRLCALTLESEACHPEKEQKPEAKTGLICEKCGSEMVLRTGKFGSFYACSQFPKCRFTKQITKEIDVACPKCGAKVLRKHGRNKTTFYSCERYPDCDFSSWDMPTKEKCPSCGGMLFFKKGKNLLVCAEKACGYKRESELELGSSEE